MSNNSFWEFSLQLYAEKGVADACLTLQNQFDLDVNLVLFCAWHGKYYGAFTTPVLREALAFSVKWRDNVVQPLRSARRWMKASSPSSNIPQNDYGELRDGIKQLELQAERLQQNNLQSFLVVHNTSDRHIPRQSCEENLAAYLRLLAIEPDPELHACYARILNTVFH